MITEKLLTLLKHIMNVILTICSGPLMLVGMILMLYGWVFLVFRWLRKFLPGHRLTKNPEYKSQPVYNIN